MKSSTLRVPLVSGTRLATPFCPSRGAFADAGLARPTLNIPRYVHLDSDLYILCMHYFVLFWACLCAGILWVGVMYEAGNVVVRERKGKDS